MHPNAQLIHDFYAAFARKDYATMQRSYHAQATFTDPVFVGLSSQQVCAMWEMFCVRGGELHISFKDVQANDSSGSVQWTATYVFTATGRKVVNVITAQFEFSEGSILHHKDHFNFYRWAQQAFGITGWLLGWAAFFRKKVQTKAMDNLQRFMQRSQN